MIYLNAGNLWTDSYLDKVIELNKKYKSHDIQVASMFGSISGLTPTARSADRIPYLKWDDTLRYIDRAQSNDIMIRYTLNQSCIGSVQQFKTDWEDGLMTTITKLHDAGVHEWTVTSALLMSLLHDMFPDDYLEVSTIAEIATVEDAQRWNALGAVGVNVSTAINRDFRMLSRINEILDVTILANEACLYKCPYRRDCYNLSSHDSSRGVQFFDWYPFRRCNEQRMREPVEWLKSRMVAPQWMPLYQRKASVSRFKIAYRTHPEEVGLPILEKYVSGHFSGNWCELWPTIARLGNTSEPVEQTDISLAIMDDLGFINKWAKGLEDCPRLHCGVDCTFCYRVYEQAAMR